MIYDPPTKIMCLQRGETDAEERIPMEPVGEFVFQMCGGWLYAAVDHPNEDAIHTDGFSKVMKKRPWNESQRFEIMPGIAFKPVNRGRWAVRLRGHLMGFVRPEEINAALDRLGVEGGEGK